MRAIRRFTVRPVLPPALSALGDLAGNLRWSWHPPTQDVFAEVDPETWEATKHDPVRLLGAVGPDRLEQLASDQGFLDRLGAAKADLDAYLGGERWYAAKAGPEAPTRIAYFSPEFGITATLPQYSGGLGILAGDHLKAASDLGVPLVGVGLLYHAGYFKQSLSREGWQLEQYPVLDPDELPIRLLRDESGARATISIALPDGPDLLAKIWVAQVGRVPLLLLDSDVEGNPDHYREVTDRLYGGTSEHRLRQEILLGIGGVRALREHARITGSSEPEVFHTNEGHAGFLGLERIRELTVEESGPQLDFDTALEVSRASTVFTTHTPVPAGIDRFTRDLIEQYFGSAGPLTGVPIDRILALGAEDYVGGDPTVFNTAVMGFRLAQRANGVSQLHGHVSREMFHGLWPAFDEAEVPITSITNGVHAPTWVGREVFDLATRHGADGDGDGDDIESFWTAVDHAPSADIWAVKRLLRERLVHDARRRLAQVEPAARHRRGRADLGRRGARPRRADHRLRAPRAVVQAADADAARPRAAQAAAAPPRASGAAADRRQGPPGRRRRQEADPGARPLLRRGQGPAPHRVPAELRHRDGPAALPRLRRLAEQPAPALRGLRYVGHEGRAERRPQPLDPRRLVGRVVRRLERVGDPLRRRRRRRRPS